MSGPVDVLAVMSETCLVLRTHVGISPGWRATELATARDAVAELIDASRQFFDAQAELDNHEFAGINADDYSKLMRHRNWAREELDAALARVGCAA